MYGLKFKQSLHEAFDHPTGSDNVRTAFKLIRGDVNPLDVSEAARQLHERCWNRPDMHYITMTALDDLLGTHGVEHIGHVELYHGPPVEYLNAGDTYTATLVWYRDMNRFRVETVADAVEWLEKRGISTDGY